MFIQVIELEVPVVPAVPPCQLLKVLPVMVFVEPVPPSVLLKPKIVLEALSGTIILEKLLLV